jgi:hypothetical protein
VAGVVLPLLSRLEHGWRDYKGGILISISLINLALRFLALAPWTSVIVDSGGQISCKRF